MAGDALEAQLERQIETLGFEFVELERAGSKARPILRLRIDMPGGSSEPGQGVTLEDCTRVSRALEAYLEEQVDIAERYTLEVSSPGIERPLVRRRDFERFAGRTVALRGSAPLAGRARRLEGELLGMTDADAGDGGAVRIRLDDGAEVTVPRADITRANLVFRWDERG